MSFGWIYRTFFEKFLVTQNNLTRCQENNNANDNKIQGDSLEVQGHRYRYFIPQVNSNSNPISPCIFRDNPSQNKESNFLKEDELLENKITMKKEAQNSNLPKLFSKVKKFYIIQTDNRTDFQKNFTYFMEQNQPTVRHFLVIPLPNEDLMKDILKIGILPSIKPIQKDEQGYPLKLDTVVDEASKIQISDECIEEIYDDDILNEEIYDDDISKEETKTERDYLYESSFNKKFNDWKSPELKDEDELKIPSINSHSYINFGGNHGFESFDKEFDSFNLTDDWWWDNMVEPEIAKHHEKFRSSLEKTTKTQKNTSFLSSFKNVFFKTSVNQSYDDFESSFDH